MKELSKEEFMSTFDEKMNELDETAETLVDIWPYVNQLAQNKIIAQNVVEEGYVYSAYRNNSNTFDHVLLPPIIKNVHIVIVIDIVKSIVWGHYRLDLNAEYSIT